MTSVPTDEISTERDSKRKYPQYRLGVTVVLTQLALGVVTMEVRVKRREVTSRTRVGTVRRRNREGSGEISWSQQADEVDEPIRQSQMVGFLPATHRRAPRWIDLTQPSTGGGFKIAGPE